MIKHIQHRENVQSMVAGIVINYFFMLWLCCLEYTIHHLFLKINLFIYLFLVVLGLHCCTRAFSSCGQRGPLFVAVRRLLIAVACLCCRAWALGTRASVVVACRLSSCGLRALEHRLSSCGAWAQLLCGMWDPPGPGPEPVSPALADGFLTTAPPGKSHHLF